MNATNYSENDVLFREIVPGGASWTHVLKRGTALRLIDCEGGGNASMIFLNPLFPAERYNMPDTLKAQHVARLTTGCGIYSDMGRILVSIIQDSCGWHDTIAGFSTRENILKKFGERSYQKYRNDFLRNSRDCFINELSKLGLDTRDLGASVNFFSKVVVSQNGAMEFIYPHSQQGDCIDLRAEMDTLIIMNTCPHPLHPPGDYPRKPIEAVVWSCAAPGSNDVVKKFRPENERGLTLSYRYSM